MYAWPRGHSIESIYTEKDHDPRKSQDQSSLESLGESLASVIHNTTYICYPAKPRVRNIPIIHYTAGLPYTLPPYLTSTLQHYVGSVSTPCVADPDALLENPCLVVLKRSLALHHIRIVFRILILETSLVC